MSPFLPFDIIELIIDIIGELKDIDLLKELALVSHFFLQICRKYVFAAIDLYDPSSCPRRPASSKQGFIKLLKNNPGIVKHIRKLTYNISHHNLHNNLRLSPILPNFLRTISHLDCLTITNPYCVSLDWNTLDPALESALLFLMHLPTINHISLAWISNFPLPALTPCLNLNWLDIYSVKLTTPLEGDSHTESTHLEVPRIHRFSTGFTANELLDAKWRDGRPVFNFRHLKQLSMPFSFVEDVRFLLQNAKQLEELRIEGVGMSYMRLHEVIYPIAHTLRFLSLSVPLDHSRLPLADLCQELKAMAGHYVLEALEFRVDVGDWRLNDIGFSIQKLQEVLVKPGWSTLKQVSFEMLISPSWSLPGQTRAQSRDTLQSLPEGNISRISKLESITFKYLVHVENLKWEHEYLGFRNFASRTSRKFRQYSGSAVRWMIGFPRKRLHGLL